MGTFGNGQPWDRGRGGCTAHDAVSLPSSPVPHKDACGCSSAPAAASVDQLLASPASPPSYSMIGGTCGPQLDPGRGRCGVIAAALGGRGGSPLLLPPDPQDLSSLTSVVLDLWIILHFLHFLPPASTACRQAGALCLYLIAHLPFECIAGDKTLFKLLKMFRGERTRDDVLG